MSTERLWTKGFIILFFFDLFFQFSMYSSNTFISIYAVSLGATYAIAGLLSGMNPGATTASRPFVGYIADRYNKKSLLLGAAALGIAATIGCAAIQNLVIIGMLRILQGIAFALRSVCVVSIGASIIPAKRLGLGMGWLGAGVVIAQALGPLFGDWVSSAFGYQTCFFMSGVTFCIAFTLGIFIQTKQTQSKRKKPHATLKQILSLSNFIYKRSVPITIIAALSGASQAVCLSLLLIVADVRGIEGGSLYFLVYAATTFCSKPLVGRLQDMLGTNRIIIPLTIINIVGALNLAFAETIPFLCSAAVFVGLGQGSLYTVLQAEAMRGVPEEDTGKAANTFYIGPDINMFVLPIVGGAVLEAFGATILYFFTGTLSFIGLIYTCYWVKQNND